MFQKLLYKKSFPKDPVLEELEKQESADAFNAYHAKFSSFTEMMDYVEKNTTYIPSPYKI